MINIANYSSVLQKTTLYKAELVAVSKTKPIEDILALFVEGQRIFGENRVQELVSKYESLPKDIHWHMIGSLQRKKVKLIAPFVSLIHSVDSFRLLLEIDKQAAKSNRVINCLLQFHIAQEYTKSGLSLSETTQILSSDDFQKLNNVNIVGVMGMATFTTNMIQVRNEFSQLKKCFNELKINFFNDNDSFNIVSMGMSGDFEIALEEGSTMVRVGSLLFGSRT
jgi:PLP dependent protein